MSTLSRRHALMAGGSGDPYWSSVVSLLNFDGADGSASFVDETGKVWTARGTAKISTTNPKYGNGCMLLDGNGDGITCLHNDFILGTGDFTIETWVRFEGVGYGYGRIQQQSTYPDNSGVQVNVYTGENPPRVQAGSYVAGITSTDTLTLNAYRHIASVRQSGVFRLFIDGVMQGSGIALTNNFSSNRLDLGSAQSDGAGFKGRMDSYRLTKGVARYWDNFTPPAAAFAP